MMKKLISAALLLFLAGAAAADSTTSRLSLTKPTIGSAGWGTKVNTNYDTIDAGVGVLAATGVWTAAQTFGTNAAIVGKRASFLGYATADGTDSNFEIGDGASVYWRFARNVSNAFRMDLSNTLGIMGGFNVGIGTATPQVALDVVGSIKASGQIVTSRTASRAAVIDAAQQLSTSAVTTTELGYVSGVTSAIQTQINALAVPPGVIQMYGAASAPTGWLLCDGSSVSTTTYSALFAIIGTTYGGSGANFTLPDFRGVFPKGAGTTARSAGKDASGNFYAGTLGTYSTDQFQGHYHNVVDFGSVVSFIPTTNNGVAGNSKMLRGSGTDISQNFSISSALTDGTNGTPRTGHTSEPQSLGISFIIKT